MQEDASDIADLGNEPPLIADGRVRPPDRREISARWLSGTFLTGLTSTALMGVALFAALDGREQLATPPEIASASATAATSGSGEEAKAQRVAPPRVIGPARDRRRMEVSTAVKVGDREVVRRVPFMHVQMALASAPESPRNYPPFDPLNVFADDGAASQPAVPTGLLYGARVESEMSLKTIDFPLATASYDERSDLSADEVEQVVRKAGADLGEGAIQVAALHYVDPQRFGDSLGVQALAASYAIRIVPENVSVASRSLLEDDELSYAEEVIPLQKDTTIADALAGSDYTGEDAQAIAAATARMLSGDMLKAGTVLSVGLEIRGDRATVIRLSVYRDTEHVLTMAHDDHGRYVVGAEPDRNPELLSAFNETPPPPPAASLPSVYDGIYRAAFSYGLSRQTTRQLIRLLASGVDFQSRLSPTDRLEVFYSQPDEDDKMSDDSQVLYVSATFGGTTRRYYRFQMQDGTVDYFDPDGRSTQQFLMRKPVPNAVFKSGFGGRRHPILGYVRMHTGVDWSAPSGTPILAAGNGVVEKAGWSGGYGRQTIVRHTNGYETSYNHQSAFAKGIQPGVKVRQGQVIGYVGATGLATGPHLHFEVMVNGTKVDPMRVKLPVGRVLAGKDLDEFKHERERIDELLNDEDNGAALKVASTDR